MSDLMGGTRSKELNKTKALVKSIVNTYDLDDNRPLYVINDIQSLQPLLEQRINNTPEGTTLDIDLVLDQLDRAKEFRRMMRA